MYTKPSTTDSSYKDQGPYYSYLTEVAKLVRSLGYRVEITYQQAGFDEKLNRRKYTLLVESKSPESNGLVKKLLSDKEILFRPRGHNDKAIEVVPSIQKPFVFEPKTEDENNKHRSTIQTSGAGTNSVNDVVSLNGSIPKVNGDVEKPGLGVNSCQNLEEEFTFLQKKSREKKFSIGGEKIESRGGLKTKGTFYYVCAEKYASDFVAFLKSIGYGDSNISIGEQKKKGFIPITLYMNHREGRKKKEDKKVSVDSTPKEQHKVDSSPTLNHVPTETTSKEDEIKKTEKIPSVSVSKEAKQRVVSCGVTISFDEEQFQELLQGATDFELLNELKFRGNFHLSMIPEEEIIRELRSRGPEFMLKLFTQLKFKDD